jgi:hypothetical protein
VPSFSGIDAARRSTRTLGNIIMRCVIPTILGLLCALSATADEGLLSGPIDASVVFRDDFEAGRRYPHTLQVFLRLENVHDSDVSWVSNKVTGIEAELLDAAGKPVPGPSQAASISFSSDAFLLPFRSRLEWLVSHGGISLIADASDKYALMVGGRGWLIPIEEAFSYSLRIRLLGVPWNRTVEGASHEQFKVLLDVPATKIELSEMTPINRLQRTGEE